MSEAPKMSNDLIDDSPDPFYLIWSNEHRAWWRPGHAGYTNRIEAAGRYSRVEALRICNNANYSWDENNNPYELPILETDALELKCKAVKEGTA
jgi:hypothetical protein